MMRKILYLVLAVVGLSSCSDLLDVEPENAITFTNYFKSEEELNSVNAQMNFFLKNLGAVENTHCQMGEIWDDASSVTYSNMRSLYADAIFASPGVSWKTHYNVIHFANLVLDNIHRVPNLSEERQNFYLGQSYFAKGYMYFCLARDWGNAVITEDSESQDMLGNSHDYEVLDEAIRNGELAFDALKNFEELVDVDGNALSTKQYAGKGTAAALLAHAWAWKGAMIELYGWEGDAAECYRTAINYCSLLIEGKVGNYALEVDPEALCVNSLSKPGQEVIFCLAYDETASTYPNTVSFARFYTSWPVNTTVTEADVKTKTFRVKASRIQDIYEAQDKRRNSFFYELDEMAEMDENITGGYAYVYKWREGRYMTAVTGVTRMQSVRADYVVWRLADIYLLRAECYAKLGDPLAQEDLNEIRSRAGATAYPAAGENDILLAIFRERERELIFEGHRYYDAVRNNYLLELDDAYGELSEQDIQDGALYLPIDDGAFEMNDMMRQNTYWFKFDN